MDTGKAHDIRSRGSIIHERRGDRGRKLCGCPSFPSGGDLLTRTMDGGKPNINWQEIYFKYEHTDGIQAKG